MRALPATRRRIGVARIGLTIVALAAVLTTAACATGQQAPTANESPAIDGNNASVGSILLKDVAILAPTNGPSYPTGSAAEVTAVIINNGTADDTLVGVGASAARASTLYSNITDAAAVLTPSASTSTPASSPPSGSTATPGASSTASAPTASTSTGTTSTGSTASGTPAPSPSATGALTSLAIGAGELVSLGVNGTDDVLVLTGLTQTLYPGTELTLTFSFQNAGSVSLVVPVQLSESTYTPLVVPSVLGT